MMSARHPRSGSGRNASPTPSTAGCGGGSRSGNYHNIGLLFSHHAHSSVQDDDIRSLYESSAYPAVSYPACDPAVMAVAAKLAGLSTPPPSCARILEIGCSSGHHLLHLAERWPESRFTGIDISGSA